jgi:hypothetical protein
MWSLSHYKISVSKLKIRYALQCEMVQVQVDFLNVIMDIDVEYLIIL